MALTHRSSVSVLKVKYEHRELDREMRGLRGEDLRGKLLQRIDLLKLDCMLWEILRRYLLKRPTRKKQQSQDEDARHHPVHHRHRAEAEEPGSAYNLFVSGLSQAAEEWNKTTDHTRWEELARVEREEYEQRKAGGGGGGKVPMTDGWKLFVAGGPLPPERCP
jgi:hypothetical protein